MLRKKNHKTLNTNKIKSKNDSFQSKQFSLNSDQSRSRKKHSSNEHFRNCL